MKAIYYLFFVLALFSITACGGADYNPEYNPEYDPEYGNTSGSGTILSGNIEAEDFSGSTANIYTSTTVKLKDTPEKIYSLTIELEYDPAILQYYSLENAGVFMQGYGFGMETTHISETDKSGIIFKFQTTDDSLYLPADSSGLIAKINFKILKDARTTVKILETTFDDTYPNWTKKDGVFTVSTI